MTVPDHVHYDAVVVGARAAGSAVAMLLARRGWRVLALERAAFGTDTSSTHALMKGGVVQLHRWGLLDRIEAAGTPALRTTLIHYGDEVVEIPMKPAGGVDALYAPRRTVLDPVLATAAVEAGAELRFDTTVTGVRRDDRGRVCGVDGRTADGERFTVAASLTIGADGVGSRVARAVDAPVTHQGRHHGAVAYTYVDGSFPSYEWAYGRGAAAGAIPTNDGSLLWVAMPPGRFGAVIRGRVEQGFWSTLSEVAPGVHARAREMVRTSRFHTDAGRPGFVRRPRGRGWALAGDAGHYKDPIGAHGLTDAMRDAELLAIAADRGLRDPAAMDEALVTYEAERDRLSGPIHEAVEVVASFRWTMEELRERLVDLSRAMGREVEALLALDLPTART